MITNIPSENIGHSDAKQLCVAKVVGLLFKTKNKPQSETTVVLHLIWQSAQMSQPAAFRNKSEITSCFSDFYSTKETHWDEDRVNIYANRITIYNTQIPIQSVTLQGSWIAQVFSLNSGETRPDCQSMTRQISLIWRERCRATAKFLSLFSSFSARHGAVMHIKCHPSHQ